MKKVTKGRIVIHRSIDSTEIDARERAATKDEKAAAAELAAIRAQVDVNTEDYNALALQKERDPGTNLSLLPALCDWGCKRNSKGKTQYWRGYKLHIAVADANPRRGAPKPDGRGERAVGITPAEKIRFRNRSGVERVNGHLHDAHGGRTVRVRGHAKVLLHLMLGLLVIAVEQSAQMLC